MQLRSNEPLYNNAVRISFTLQVCLVYKCICPEGTRYITILFLCNELLGLTNIIKNKLWYITKPEF